MQTDPKTNTEISFEDFRDNVLTDYRIAVTSRECSLLGRREVLTGKAKFGIFGDGKEVPQLAWAKAFKNGDWRSGYYRDQTFMMAIGELSIEQFFAGLYAHTDIKSDPMSGGRQMGGHFATHSLNEDGSWKNLTAQKNSSSDISPTAGQMPRLLGLAQASKIFRNVKGIQNKTNFSINGNEVAWGTIGNASTSEGLFWETINAAGVLQVPMVTSVWDDEYGISVHAKYQTTKENISEILKGFQRNENEKGFEIIRVKGWDYPELVDAYERAAKIAREEHVPVLIHVQELTQPQGHSTSGSHERYKSEERLEWESNHDCNKKMREWIISSNIATDEQLSEIESEIRKKVREGKKAAWNAFLAPQKQEQQEAITLLGNLAESSSNKNFIEKIKNDLASEKEPARRDILGSARKALRYVVNEDSTEKKQLQDWISNYYDLIQPKYSAHLYSEEKENATTIKEVVPTYDNDSEEVDGRVVLRDNFDSIFQKYPESLIFGEDAGKIGDVNQGLEGMQEKHGKLRVADSGIREATILGQGIGMALRGLRPIAEIQYLDYLLYCLQIMSDDLATVQYRTAGGQKAPLIIRTRGHRLEGIWHSGSPMAAIINSVKGIHVCVPRNLTTAAGFYNTLLQGDDPALIIEPLNAYRSKEKMPANLGEFQVELGVPEIVTEGSDLTIVSYGSTCNLAEEACKELNELGISAELIDIRTLMPFDKNHRIVESLKKTNKVLFLDEDVKGGASAYMMQKVLEEQGGYYHLDVEPKTLSSKDHRPAYGTDGDYFSKPSIDDIVETAYQLMRDVDPENYPALY